MNDMAYLEELTDRYPGLDPVKESVRKAYEILKECFSSGHKLLVAGNGGSAADSEHIVGELMKGFVKRRCLPERTGIKAPGRPSGHCPYRPSWPFHGIFK